MKKLFQGVATALITPFDEDGSIDFDTLGMLVDLQVKNGINAIVSCGTTGECATLSDDEFESVVSFTVKRAAGRVPVIAGTGRNCTKSSLNLSLMAESAGADGLLMVNPYYNKSTQSGLIRHFTHIAQHVDVPIILYNVPSRTGMSFSAQTYQTLSQVDNIVGVKEASGDFSLVLDTIASCPVDFSVYSGNDDHILPMLSLGGQGVISTVSNIVPKMVTDVCASFFNNDIHLATMHQAKLQKLIRTIFSQTNPIPLKAAMSLMGLDSGVLRPPLYGMDAEPRAQLENVLIEYDLIPRV